MNKTALWALTLLALAVLSGVGFHQAAAEAAKSDAKAKPKPRATPATLAASPRPASTRARIPEVDLYPVSIELTRRVRSAELPTAYFIRVAYMCQSNLPLRIAPVVRVRNGHDDVVDYTQPLGPCAAGTTSEFRWDGSPSSAAVLDPANAIGETNESNNTCSFERAQVEAARPGPFLCRGR